MQQRPLGGRRFAAIEVGEGYFGRCVLYWLTPAMTAASDRPWGMLHGCCQRVVAVYIVITV